jgi:predicted permease
VLDRLRFDLVTAVRSLVSTPVPSVAALVTLAAAVGLNLAMFGRIDRALLSPPSHVADPVRVFTAAFHGGDGEPDSARMISTSYVVFRGLQQQVPAFAAVGAFQRTATSAMVDGHQHRVDAMIVSGSYFDLLGARASVGRAIRPADDVDGAAPVVVLSDRFWRSAFGADSGVVGRRVSVAGLDYVVGGVMPAGFSGHSATAADVWMPFAAAMRNSPGWDRAASRNVGSIVVRLAPDATLVAAETQASAAGRRTRLSPIVGADVAAAERRVAWWLGGVSVLVLVIGLANAATLLVVRAARRHTDMTIRAALGASRGRLARQVAIEASLLAGAAVTASVLLASTFDDAMRRVLFRDVVGRSAMDGRTLTIAATVALLAAGVGAAAAIWHLPSRHTGFPSGALGAATRATRGRRRATHALLLVQTTLCVLLLAGAGVFGRSLLNLASQDFGMQMRGAVLVEFDSVGSGPREDIFADAIDRVRALPGVDVATLVGILPFTGFNVPPISVPGRDQPSIGGQLPFLNAATPELLRILGIQIVEGRGFTAADDRGAPVVIVNQTMAREVWPGESAIGKCIRIGFDPDFDPETSIGPPTPSAKVPCREVIGVAHDVRQRSLLPVENETRLMQYFVPYSQVPKPPFVPSPQLSHGILLRSNLAADTLAPSIRAIVVGDRSDVPFVRVIPYAQTLDRQMRPWALGTTLLALFSALALGVAALGIYAAFAQAVVERRREMAIRLAIGARPGLVLRLVLRESLAVAMAGALLGSCAAILSGRWIQSLLFKTAPSDAGVLAPAAAIMLAVAAAATVLPAWTASKIDPGTLLKAE